MTTSIYLDRAKTVKDGKRWALWLREWNGIDRPDKIQLVTFGDEVAKTIERTEQVQWQAKPDWHKVELESEKAKLKARLEEIDRKLK